jgi:hypothetical protein
MRRGGLPPPRSRSLGAAATGIVTPFVIAQLPASAPRVSPVFTPSNTPPLRGKLPTLLDHACKLGAVTRMAAKRAGP